MTRDVKLYLAFVALPTAFLVAGGFRFVSLESERARSSAIESLNERAAAISRAVSERLGDYPECCEPPMEAHRPHRRRGQEGREWHLPRFGRPPRGACLDHALPEEVKSAVAEAAESLQGEFGGPERIVEVRHRCGCTVIPGAAPITGRIAGRAFIGKRLPGYYVLVAPEGGDEAVAAGARSRAAVAAILVLLFAATLSAGVALLVRSARRAREDARRKTDFLSNVSHELKTPLTSIAMFSEMLAGGGLSGESISRAAASVLRESRRLAARIDGLLEYSRLERGARRFSPEDFDLDGLLEELRESFAPSFPEGLSADGAGVRVFADREAVRRILDCIVENAAKYASGAPVRISASRTGGVASVSVADLGPGIPRGAEKKAFERFWRGDDSLVRTAGGTGLGLAIARELARGMGGDVSVAPNRPSGAVFTLTLPAGGGKEARDG